MLAGGLGAGFQCGEQVRKQCISVLQVAGFEQEKDTGYGCEDVVSRGAVADLGLCEGVD